MIVETENHRETIDLGLKIGRLLRGGEVIELIGDVGAGKTTFVRGLAVGLGVNDNVQSPSFTISQVYEARDGLTLYHYDFYRLDDAGIMVDEISESIDDSKSVVVVEWADTVTEVLPADRIVINIKALSDNARQFHISGIEEGI